LSGSILIVEDDEKTLKLLKDILIFGGYQVIEAKDGNEAIEITFREIPDLVTMDMQLPGINGLDVTRIIKANPSTMHIPIIAITASAMKGQDQIIQQAGCDSYVLRWSPKFGHIVKVESCF
jgi:two-component system, cell cycle response regulator DivK